MSPIRRRQLFATLGIMLAGALAEMIAIGAVLPFLALIVNPHPELVPQWLQQILAFAPGGPLLGAALLLAAAAVLLAVVRLLLLSMSQRFALSWGGELAALVFGRMLRQPYSAYLDRNSSELLAGLEKVNRLIVSMLQPALQGAIAIVLATCVATVLFVINPLAATVTGLSIGFAYGLMTLFIWKRLALNSLVSAHEMTARTQIVRESLGGIRDVLLDHSQEAFESRFARVEMSNRRAMAQNAFFAGAPRFVLDATGVVALACVAVALSFRSGGILAAVPVLGALGLGAQRLIPLLQQAWVGWVQVGANTQLLVDVANFVEMPIEIEGFQAPLPFCRSIDLVSVSFIYSGGRRALEDVSLSIRRGERVGIAGATGSGKTTLIDILMGLLSPTSGLMAIDGDPLDKCGRARWRANISHVSQSTYLSDNTISANILFGIPGPVDPDRLRQAIETAQLASFVDGLREGMSTSVGERGVRLSGGQRQRIGIARALYRAAPVLILDEATSALDETTEMKLVDALAALDRDMTLIVVSHRGSTLALCDRIITLEDCWIIDPGVRRGSAKGLPRTTALRTSRQPAIDPDGA